MGKLTQGLVTELKILYLKEFNLFDDEYTKGMKLLVASENRPGITIDDIAKIKYPAFLNSLEDWKSGTPRPKGADDIYASQLTIERKGISIDVDEDDIEHGDILKIKNRIVDHARISKSYWGKRLFQMIAAGNGTTYGTGLGSQTFFADDHVLGESGTIDNLLAIDLSAANMNTIYAHFANQKDERGEYLGLVPKVLMVPPALAATAFELCVKLNGVVYTDAVKTQYIGRLEVLLNPHMTDANSWAVFVTGQPRTAPFVFIDKDTKPKVKTDLSKLYDEETVRFGIDSKGGMGYGDWRLAVLSLGSS